MTMMERADLGTRKHYNTVAGGKSDRRDIHFHRVTKMIDDNDLGFFANFLGVFIFVLVIAYHYVVADPKYEGN
ncbi:hypothetical protein P8452_67073 [Trifolium repens]|nr:hypothetical protein P8452_67073 [Trifolium repens]